MTKLFKKKNEQEKLTARIEIRYTPADALKLREAASVRVMDVSEYIRKVSLGKRADVRYETEVISELRKLVISLNSLRKDLFNLGHLSEEEKWSELRNEAMSAMKRIEK